MKIIVNPHTIQLDKTTIVNVGEYNIQNCEFEFSSEYDGLVRVALFSTCDNTYQLTIVNNQCMIPSEILQEEGNVMLGVYGYEVNGEDLIKRYSPTPIYFTIDKGSYGTGEQPTPPTPSVIEQLQQQITDNANNISTLQDLVSANTCAINDINDIIPTLAKKTEIPTKTSQLTNDSNFAYKSDIPDVSNYVEKDTTELENYTLTNDLSQVALSGKYDDLLNKPELFSGDYNDLTNKPNLSIYATTQQLGNETTLRENADIGLQSQIDAITSSSDVKDIVGTYTELENYDTSTLGNDDIIKVLQDSTHNNAMTYYRWVITESTGAWQYIGQEGPYYTKSESDILLQAKQSTINLNNKLASDLVDDTGQTNLFVNSNEKNTWNNKSDFSGSYNDLSNKPDLSVYELLNNKVTSLSSSSTDTQYPSAKCVYDLVGDIETILTTLTVGNGV